MSLVAFLEELRHRDIRLSADGERLRCNAPAGALTAELRAQLRERKDELLNFLRSARALAEQQCAIVPLQPHGERCPVFAVAGHNGDVFCYRALARHLGDDQPFFGLQPPGLDGQARPLASVEKLAAYFAAQILAFHPVRPCVIAGYCAGGTIAFELARQLSRQGVAVRFAVLFGSPYPAWYRWLPQLRRGFLDQLARLRKHARTLVSLGAGEGIDYLREKLDRRRARHAAVPVDPLLAWRATVEKTTLAALCRYTPRHFPGRLEIVLPNRDWASGGNVPQRWPSSLAAEFREQCGPDGCDGDNMLREPQAAASARLFTLCRDRPAAESA